MTHNCCHNSVAVMCGSFSFLLLFLNLFPFGVFSASHLLQSNDIDTPPNDCSARLPSGGLKSEIASYAKLAQNIMHEATNGSFRHRTYNELAAFIDRFGARMSGTENLEHAIDYMLNISQGLDRVYTEPVQVPFWKRGKEYASMVVPWKRPISILGLGTSIGTNGSLVADALVVRSFDELEQHKNEILGKIVIYNQPYVTYGTSVRYRSQGASEAAKYGAVAALIRSVTDFSMATLHTGHQTYTTVPGIPRIPAACITVEDAEMFQRIQDRKDVAANQSLRLELYMDDWNLGVRNSRNTIAEIKGTQYPNRVVVVSGHLDSWDVGTGAMDDGGGAFISWAAVSLLKKLKLQPKRTIRAIFWTGEEQGLVGAYQYFVRHQSADEQFTFLMESDEGTFNPLGLEADVGPLGFCILQEALKLLEPLGTTTVKLSRNVGSDITWWTSKDYPGASLLNQNNQYFWYHHTAADTMQVEDPGALDRATALWATISFILADISVEFPKKSADIKK